MSDAMMSRLLTPRRKEAAICACGDHCQAAGALCATCALLLERELEDAEAERDWLAAENEKIKGACKLYRMASLQAHSAHWDLTGQGGVGCPECLRATELRDRADALRAALEE